ncbi:unnamed protein product [Symbiodinium sp. KB8]|nr:unnamed protein product [Symbiodinium sp. KB8]
MFSTSYVHRCFSLRSTSLSRAERVSQLDAWRLRARTDESSPLQLIAPSPRRAMPKLVWFLWSYLPALAWKEVLPEHTVELAGGNDDPLKMLGAACNHYCVHDDIHNAAMRDGTITAEIDTTKTNKATAQFYLYGINSQNRFDYVETDYCYADNPVAGASWISSGLLFSVEPLLRGRHGDVVLRQVLGDGRRRLDGAVYAFAFEPSGTGGLSSGDQASSEFSPGYESEEKTSEPKGARWDGWAEDWP